MLHVTVQVRKEAGRHCTLADEAGETLVDCRPDPALFSEFVDRTLCTTSVQVGPVLSEHEVRLLSELLRCGLGLLSLLARAADTFSCCARLTLYRRTRSRSVCGRRGCLTQRAAGPRTWTAQRLST